MNGYLTTHVLDTANGCPGEGIELTLFKVEEGQLIEVVSAVTNDDGRVDSPILPKGKCVKGVYELHFMAGDYFRRRGTELAEPAFLDQVVIRFGIADEEAHYHVPLLISPYSYSTYRGS
ncbi:hydroxyisourate hydrolase [Marinobacterium sp. xm-a-152]|uniref:hydroxyisourate hydrolase n=1 Tax=Marinobacterium sp. xm-a-152 TaxID=2497733 RepID=UPI0015689DB7|nr:hydroxyisourate hydrolase [Marinobacterium sp. xm-a-152]NRP16551.1 5-hydroxyisourate hydrolase [Marinobacterium sp. xm-a-152]